MAAVSALLSPVSSEIRSGIATPTLGQCIEELVVNSLDSQSTHILVEFDIKRLNFKVTDNGCGFNEENIRRAGTRYSTSKCLCKSDVDHNLRFYGFRGEALASIACLSDVLEITSRRSGSNEVLQKFIEGKKNKVTSISCNPNCTGETSVTVKSLYKNMPVRRYGIDVELETEALTERIRRVAIVHPQTSFVLIDKSKSDSDFRVPRHKSCLSRFQFMFSQFPSVDFMNEISTPEGMEYRIQGAISRHGVDSKYLQFVFVNGRPVLRTKIHKELNEILKKSDIGHRKEICKEGDGYDRRKRKSDFSTKLVTKRTYGVYFLNILCSHSKYDISFEPEKTMIEFENWNKVLEIVRSTVNRFLKENNLLFSPGQDNQFRDEAIEDLTPLLKKTAVGDLVPHDAAIFGETAHKSDKIYTTSIQSFCDKNELENTHRSTPDKPQTDQTNKQIDSVKEVKTSDLKSNSRKSDWISKYDVKLGGYIYINVVTGMSTAKNPAVADAPEKISLGFGYESQIRSREFAPTPKDNRPQFGCHSRNTKKNGGLDWKNPAIPIKANIADHLDKRNFSSLFSSSTASIKFDKEIYQRLQIIGQLDCKFIVCLLHFDKYDGNEKGTCEKQKVTLVLFDQHAVHERIRLERLEKDLQDENGIKSNRLEDEILIQLRENEYTLMKAWEKKFDRTGLHYRTENKDGDKCKGIRVTSVPTPLVMKVDKFRKEGEKKAELVTLIYSLIREQLQVIRETAGASHSIPKCLFDILCSQACHGAIRFGDQLSLRQCSELLKSLSTCQLPFQCAHGRPSLTPICFQLNSREKDIKPNLGKIKNLCKLKKA